VTELRQGDERVSFSVHPFVPTKHLDLVDPKLVVDVREDGEQLSFQLTSQSLARFVELKLDGAPEVVFSDKYFDLPVGRTVVVTCPLPEKWTETRAKDALRVYSLYASFAGK